MNEFLSVLAVALLPVVGNFLGAALAEVLHTARWVIGAALHAAAGVAMALVSVELMPRVLDTTPMWLIALLFAVGAALSVGMARSVSRLQQGGDKTGPWKVYAATSADLFSDGLMTGAGSAVSGGLGLLLALSQVVANFPGGFATVANFRGQGIERKRRLLAAASFALPVIIGASLGYWGLSHASEEIQDAMLALIAGLLLVATIEDLVPQADKPGTARWISTSAFVGGFAFFALLTSYVG